MLDHVEEIYHDGIMITKEVNVLNLVGEDVKEISTILLTRKPVCLVALYGLFLWDLLTKKVTL